MIRSIIFLFALANLSFSIAQNNGFWKIGSSIDSLKLDEVISSSDYSYYISDSLNLVSLNVSQLNPIIDTITTIDGYELIVERKDTTFFCTNFYFVENESPLNAMANISGFSELNFTCIYDIINLDSRKHGLQIQASNFSELMIMFEQKLIDGEADIINFYGINLYENEVLIGGIGCGNTLLISSRLQDKVSW